MDTMTDTIHLCCWGDQPDIQIYCDESWTTPKWGGSPPDRPNLNLYLSDDDRWYTFTKELITCSACINKNRKE
jgi:hypothetical protein